jgi:ubiquinone/menaquinone biosynthesis C-methylase UbiE
MNKGDLSITLRKVGLMHLTDNLRYLFFKVKNNRKNKLFLKNNPNSKLPPDYYIYEAFQLNYEEYLTKSYETSEWIISYYEKHKGVKPETILDWGCGPGRIIRHLPDILGERAKIFGTDYNKRSIEWCKNNLKGIEFNHNNLEAVLPYESNLFDFIFGISIFTHLSKELHYKWIKELTRTTKKGGILFFTTHGNAFKQKLTDKELKKFIEGDIVIRGYVKEGHRTFTAYHPIKFMQNLFSSNGLKVIQHVEQESNNGKAQQDIWLLEKI